MSDDESVRILGFDFIDGITGELNVNITSTLPEIHFAAGLLHDPSTEVGVWDKENRAVFRGLIDDFHGIARGADHIAEGFDASRAIDVGDDVVILFLIVVDEFFQFVSGAGFL